MTKLFAICFMLISVSILASASLAAGVPTIVLKASRPAVLNDGKDAHEISADVRDSNGSYVPDNTQITFQTTVGQFQGNSVVMTRAGVARVRLTSLQKGTAIVTCSVSGGGFQQIQLAFTDDPAETYQGNLFVDVTASGSLLYAPGVKIIEAKGHAQSDGEKKVRGASLSFRNIQVFADSLQVDCNSNTVRARGNVTYVRGTKRFECARLYVPLFTGDAFVVAEQGRKLVGLKVKADMTTEVPKNGIASKMFELEDISEAPQVLSARQIRFFPGEKLQFKRPRLYQDGQVMFSVPFYSLSINSTQLFADQFLSLGTQGLGLDLPLYYDLSPASTGILHVRNGERSGRSQFATRPGLSLDLTQGYNSTGGKRYTGEVGFTGIAREDWGLRWNHSQEFAGGTRGSFFFDAPQHKSLFGSTNLSKQVGPLHIGVNLSANKSITGIGTSGNQGDIYIETNSVKVGRTGYTYNIGATASDATYNTLGTKTQTISQGIQARFTSQQFRMDKYTSLSNYFTIGNTWANQGRGGASAISSVSLNRTLGRAASLQMTYDYAKQPYYLIGSGSHRVSANLMLNGGSHWNFYMLSSMVLDARNSSVIGDLSYSIAPRWRLTFNSTMQQLATASYRDFALGIARTVFGRDIVLSYSTFNHRFFFDLEAGRF